MAGVLDKIKDNLKLVKSMLEDGKTDKEIAMKIDVSYASYKNYKAKNLDIKAIYDEVKEIRNAEVENSLFKLCTGYTYYEEVPTKVKEEVIVDKENNVAVTQEKVVISKVKKYKGPELAAQKYWLNNKKKAQWKEDPSKADIEKKKVKLKEKEVEQKEW